MKSLAASMKEYKKQMEKGDIRRAYVGILNLMKDIKKQLETVYPDYTFSSGIFEGRMDFTYFHFTSPLQKKHKLKIVILFVHESLTFEVLLSGLNRKIQAEYWKKFKEIAFKDYRYSNNPNTEDFIVGETITENPDFDKADKLVDLLLKKTIKFDAVINGMIEII